MSSNFHLRARGRAHRMIARRGQTAVLRRESGDREVLVLEDMYSMRDIDGQRVQLLDRRYLMSPLNAALEEVVAPDAHEDSLVLDDPMDDSNSIELIFASPPGRLSPGGIVIYYELHCRNR